MNELVTRLQPEQLKPLQEISKTSATGQRSAVPSLQIAPTTVSKGNRIWSHLSIMWNRFRKRWLESAREVAKAEREFLEESEALQRTRARYQDLGIDIEAEKQLRHDQYLAAKLDRELALEEKRLKLEQLRRARTGLEENASESGDKQYQEQLQAAMRRADFETALRIGDSADPTFPAQYGNAFAEYELFFSLDFNGLFSDNPDTAVEARGSYFE
jgi:hypothetical protein